MVYGKQKQTRKHVQNAIIKSVQLKQSFWKFVYLLSFQELDLVYFQ